VRTYVNLRFGALLYEVLSGCDPCPDFITAFKRLVTQIVFYQQPFVSVVARVKPVAVDMGYPRFAPDY
jgi:hypothetical protein